jgi:hypothetical protein
MIACRSSGSRLRGKDAVSIGGGLGTLVLYVDCPIAAKKDKVKSFSFSNKRLPVGLPDALIFPDGLLGKTELLGMIDGIPCNSVLIVCTHRFGHSVGVTGLSPSFSTVGSICRNSHLTRCTSHPSVDISGNCVNRSSARQSLQHSRH